MFAGLGPALFAACDRGDAKVEPGRQGPPPRVLAGSPAIDGGATGVLLDAPIRLRFDRYMRPDTMVRQSIRVTGGTIDPDGGASIAGDAFLEPHYDVVERVLTYTMGGQWAPSTTYSVTLWSPNDPLRAQDGNGFRALDGAPLEASLSFHFTTGTAASMATAPPPTAYECPICEDGKLVGSVPKLFAGVGRQTSCQGGACHGAGTDDSGRVVVFPAMGLDLATPAGITSTALGRVAHETIVGPDTAAAPTHPAIYGVNMPVIDPGEPSNSYLLYKMLFTDPSCDGTSCVAGPEWGATDYAGLAGDAAPSAEENARLLSFIQGTHMPVFGAITQRQMKDVQGWIATGAKLRCDAPLTSLTLGLTVQPAAPGVCCDAAKPSSVTITVTNLGDYSYGPDAVLPAGVPVDLLADGVVIDSIATATNLGPHASEQLTLTTSKTASNGYTVKVSGDSTKSVHNLCAGATFSFPPATAMGAAATVKCVPDPKANCAP